MNEIVVSQHFGVSDMERMAVALAGSKLFGIQTKEQALALCLIAQAEGRHPASAAADYHIIQGRPSKKAEAMLRDFLGAGGKVEWHTLDDAMADATFSHPQGGKARISWDAARVKQAGIVNAMHGKYPRQMLRARTVSEGVRTVFPAATSGMYVPDEVEVMEPLRDVTPRREPAQAQRLAAPEVEATPFDIEIASEGPGFADEWAAQWRAHIADPDMSPADLSAAWRDGKAETVKAGTENAALANAVKAEVVAAIKAGADA